MAVVTAIAVEVCCLSETPGYAGFREDCQGKYKFGAMPRKEELEAILEAHKGWLEWLSSDRNNLKALTKEQLFDPRKANLCNANLRPPVTLKDVDLTAADLRGADFAGNDLTDAILVGANYSHANMQSARLRNVKLDGGGHVDLTRARLEGSSLDDSRFNDSILTQLFFSEGRMSGINLDRVRLDQADLKKAVATGSSLMSVDMTFTHLDKADFSNSTFTKMNFTKTRIVKTDLSRSVIQRSIFNETIFEPTGADTLLILDSSGLSTIIFQDPRPVVQLRKSMKEAGLSNEERSLTSALRKFELRSASFTERFMQRWLFGGEITDYGAFPWRSIGWLVTLIPVFALFYAFPIYSGSRTQRRANIWAVWPEGSINKEHSVPIGARVFYRHYWINLVCGSIYFSLVSAFHIGWRDLNVGTWITRLQFREYSLRPVGWVKFVSGIQSLLSVYLLALWFLTYFGRLFE